MLLLFGVMHVHVVVGGGGGWWGYQNEGLHEMIDWYPLL